MRLRDACACNAAHASAPRAHRRSANVPELCGTRARTQEGALEMLLDIVAVLKSAPGLIRFPAYRHNLHWCVPCHVADTTRRLPMLMCVCDFNIAPPSKAARCTPTISRLCVAFPAGGLSDCAGHCSTLPCALAAVVSAAAALTTAFAPADAVTASPPPPLPPVSAHLWPAVGVRRCCCVQRATPSGASWWSCTTRST
jgi:hypothetical protein